jgi:hypothetical protein
MHDSHSIAVKYLVKKSQTTHDVCVYKCKCLVAVGAVRLHTMHAYINVNAWLRLALSRVCAAWVLRVTLQ